MLSIWKIDIFNKPVSRVNKPIEQLTYDMAFSTLNFCMELDNLKKWTLSNNIIRTSLSVEANVEKAQTAETKECYVHKMKIAANQANEMKYYLEICLKEEQLTGNMELLDQVKTVYNTISQLITSPYKINSRRDNQFIC